MLKIRKEDLAVVERFLEEGPILPAHCSRKDELWDALEKQARDLQTIRRVLLRVVATSLLREDPLLLAAEELFAARDEVDPSWRTRTVGGDQPTRLNAAWEMLSNAINAAATVPPTVVAACAHGEEHGDVQT